MNARATTPGRRGIVSPGFRARVRQWGTVLIGAAVAVTGFAVLSPSAIADEEEGTVLLEEDFSDGVVPEGWNPVLGDWQVVDGRLTATTAGARARIGFGPAAPEHYRFEATVRFVSSQDSGRWVNLGLDHHVEADWGAVLVARNGTTASDGLELAQATQGGSYQSSPVGASPVNIGIGNDSRLVVEVHGTSMTLHIDGQLAMTADNLLRTGGGFSFVINQSTMQFDDVRIVELPAPPPMPVAPSAPRNVTLSEVGDSATITWGAPADPGAHPDETPATISGYEVSLAAVDTPFDAVTWVDAVGTSHTFTGLSDSTEQVIRVRAVNSAGAAGPAAAMTPSYGTPSVAGYKLRLASGPWPSGHVQGIAVDQEGGFIYYSFTGMLVKTDLVGNVLGTVTGITGHLGDIEFNPEDGRVYGSLEYKAAEAFYIAIIDVDRVDEMGMHAQGTDLVTAVYLPDVVADFTADMDGDGVFDGNVANTADHRYGNSGIDGTSFGPKFGQTDGKQYLTVAAGIYSNLNRTDNDHQVLWQFDTSTWAQYEEPLVESAPHRNGPDYDGKYFVYTGNTTYGVQNLEYDPYLERWWLAVYTGSKPQFPNYGLFAVDADSQPYFGELVGADDEGMLLPLADDGLLHEATGIRGWWQDGSVGFESVGQGLYYVANTTSAGGQGAVLTLRAWTGDANAPFVVVTEGWEPEPEPEPIPTVTVTVTAEPTSTPTVTETVTAEPTSTPTVTETVTSEPTSTPTVTETVTAEPTSTPTVTETVTSEPTSTPTVTVTSEPTSTPTVTETVTAEPTSTPTVTETVTSEPTSTPTVTETVTAEPGSTPTVTVTSSPAPGSDFYETPGFHEVNGRRWMTVCEPYSVTTRCWTYIWGTQVTQAGSGFTQHNGWQFNNLTYVASPRGIWAGNPLGFTNRWTSEDGRQWRTECDTPAVGGNGCRSYVTSAVVEWTGSEYRLVTKEIFNNIVRFS